MSELLKGGPAMFCRRAGLEWLPGQTLSTSAERVRKRGPTRREFMAGTLAVAGFAAGPAGAKGVWNQLQNGDLELQFDDLTWTLRAAAFGIPAIPAPTPSAEGLQLTIPKVAWSGTATDFDLVLQFRKDDAGWTLTASSQRLGVAPSVSIKAFLAGRAEVAWLLKDTDAGAMAGGVGWRPLSTTARIALEPDQTWRLSTARGLLEPTTQLRARSIGVRTHAVGGGPLDGVLSAPKAASTSASGEEIDGRRAVRVACGATKAGRAVTLRARQIGEVVRQLWSSGSSALALVGDWELDVAAHGDVPGGKFQSAHGLVVLGASGHEVLAALPLGSLPRSVGLDGAAITLCGAEDAHRIDVQARGGVVERCEVRGLVTHLALRVPGADYSQMEFDGQDAFLVLHGERSLAEIFGVGFTLDTFGRWRVPLEKARLRLARAEDLLNVNLRFHDLVLRRGLTGWALEMTRDGTHPVLAADFPPQHVLEKAYLKLVDTEGKTAIKPVVPADRKELRNFDNTMMSDADAHTELTHRDPDYPTPSPNPTGEPFDEVVEARLSAPSRLAFALPLNRKGTGLRRPLQVTLEALTNWEGLEPVVTPLARTTMTKVKKGDLSSPQPDADPAHILADHGVAAGGILDARMKTVRDAVRPPGPFETSLELPARLVLSPDQNARFSARPLTRYEGAIPLWTVRMSVDPASGTGALRAVWSPDFSKDVFVQKPKALVSKEAVTPWDEEGLQQPRRLRLTMTANDRHELVALSTMYGLPTLPRIPTSQDGKPNPDDQASGSNILPPSGYALSELTPNDQGVYLPPPMQAAGLDLSSLGGSLDIEGRFQPPAAPYRVDDGSRGIWPALTVETWRQQTILGRDDYVEVVYKGFLFPIGHRASLVKRTERYFYPDPADNAPTAYLVQRYFIRISNPDRHYPGLGHPFESRDFPVKAATFKTLRTPDIQDPTDTRGNPDANGVLPNGQVKQFSPGTDALGLVFWPRTKLASGSEVIFQIEADGHAGTASVPLIFVDNTAAHDPPTMSALAAYYQLLHQDTGLTTMSWNGLARPYAPARKPGATTFETARWILGVRGRIDRPDAPFRMDGAMEGADQPPFYPWVREAHVVLKTLQQFSGRGSDHAVVSFDGTYVRSGLSTNANPALIYLGIHGYLQKGPWRPDLEPVRLTLQGQGDRSGGVAQPNIWAVNMGADLGPIGGQSAPPRPPDGPPNPLNICDASSSVPADGAHSGSLVGADYFPFDATLLGLLNLKDLVKTALIAGAPKLVAEAAAAEDEAEAQLAQLLGQIKPALDAGLGGLGAALDEIAQGLAQPLAGGMTGAKLYPRVKAALDALRTRTTDLKTAVDSEAEALAKIGAIVDALQAFNAAVGDLAAELDRVASNPTPDLLVDFRTSIFAIVDKINSRDFAKLVLAPLEPLAAAWATKLCTGAMATWRSTVFGPQVDAQCADPEKLATLDGFLDSVGQIAAEGICYEAVGRPLIQVLASAQQLNARAQAAAAADLRVITGLGLDTMARCVDAAMSVAQGPLLRLSDQANAACATVVGALVGAITKAGTRFTADVATLEQYIASIEGALDDLADVETSLNKVADQAAVTLEAARQAAANAPANTTLAAQLKTLEAAFGQLQATLNGVGRLRRGAGSAIDRLKGTLQTLGNEEAAFSALANGAVGQCPTSTTASAILDSASRWMNLRLRALADVQVVFSRAADAFGVQPPPMPPPASSPQFHGKGPADDVNGYPDAEKIIKGASDAIAKAAKAAGDLLGTSIQLLQALTTLRDASVLQDAGDLAKGLGDAITHSGDAGAQARLQTRIAAFASDGASARRALAAAQTALTTIANDDLAPAAFRIALQQALAAVAQVGTFAHDAERGLVGVIVGPMMVLGDTAKDFATAVVIAACEALLTVLKPIRDLHVDVAKAWDGMLGGLDHTKIAQIELVLQGPLDALLDTTSPGNLRGKLDADIKRLNALVDSLALRTPAGLRAAQGDLELWRAGIVSFATVSDPASAVGAPALGLLAQSLGQVLDSLVHGRLQDLVDVAKVRAALEAALLDVVLPRLTIRYGFDTDINDLPPFFSMVRDGRGDYGGDDDAKDLSLKFELAVDLKTGGQRHLSARGELQPFVVKVFEVVTLTFRNAVFLTEDGRTPQVDIKVAKSELGAAVEFVKALEQYLSPADGSGFFVNVDLDPPGVEAGFFLDLGTVSIGNVSFANIAFGASVELPFDNRPALFNFMFARASRPFLIFCSPYGGGGFLKLTSDARSIVGFEAAFQYGGGGAFSAGPLSGQGYVMTGIYISRSGESAALRGYFMAAGSAHIACFGIAASLVVGVEQNNKTGNLSGFATYVFTFSLGITDVSYSVGVHRDIAKGWSGGGSRNEAADLAVLARLPADHRSALAAILPRPAAGSAQPPVILADTHAMNENWTAYQEYFDEAL